MCHESWRGQCGEGQADQEDDGPPGVIVGHGRRVMGWGSRGHGMIWSSRYDVVVKSDGFHQTRAEGHEQKEKNIKTMKKQSNGKHESSQRNRFERVRILKIKD